MLVTTRCPDYPARDPPIAPHGFEARKALTAACGPLVLFLFCEIGPGADVSFHRTSQEIRIEVDLVDLYVTVNNKRGASVQGLGKENFRVSENEVEQEISHFDTDDAPYTIGLVLDHSGSMRWSLRCSQGSRRGPDGSLRRDSNCPESNPKRAIPQESSSGCYRWCGQQQ